VNRPLESALALAVDSGEETVMVERDAAPLPSTLRLPELSEALVTLTAASAAGGASNSAPRTDSETTAATLRPPDRTVLEGLMPPSHGAPIERRCPSRAPPALRISTPE
jgi:hypothetical protein